MSDLKTTINYDLYMLDKKFKDRKNLVKVINQAQDFYNGKHYENVNYTNMIRTTMNICSFSATIKASKINGTPIFLEYVSDNAEDCTPLRRFDEYNRKKIHLDSHNYQSALNGFVNGTEVVYLRWDDDETTYRGLNKGGIAMEHIDLRRFAVANPKLTDIQKQKYVMFWKDESVGALKELLEGTEEEKNHKKELLRRELVGEDIDGIDNSAKEDVNYGLVTLFTRFFRIDGEVYFMCSTKYVDIFSKPHPISRKLAASKVEQILKRYEKEVESEKTNDDEEIVRDYAIDYEDVVMQSFDDKVLTEEEFNEEKEKFNLYPFAVFEPIQQNDDFYGRSDMSQLIPIQKFINYGISLIMKCIENNANGKILVKPDALQGQEITNEPSQVIVDYSPFTNGWGIKYLETQSVPNAIFEFIQQLVAMVRVVYGFNDVMDGSITNQDMSGYMLQQMIKQSNTAIEQQQKLFWQFNVDMAKIRLLFYKHYVDKAKYTFKWTDAELEQEEIAQKRLLEMAEQAEKEGKTLETMPNAKPSDFLKKIPREQKRWIRNEDLYGNNFDIEIDAMQGLSDSKLTKQQFWDNLLLNGNIQNISPDLLLMWLEASPNIPQEDKDRVRMVVENIKQSQLEQLKQVNGELAERLQQAVEYIKQLTGQVMFQDKYNKNLNKEFSDKINVSKKMVEELQRKSEGEKKSENARSVTGAQPEESQM